MRILCLAAFLLFGSWATHASGEAADDTTQLHGEKLLIEARSHNGLRTVTTSWHAAVQFEMFDENGQHEDGGTFEEWWLGPRSYRSVFHSEHLKQIDVATSAGLFREGDQRWMTARENEVVEYLLSPIDFNPVASFGDEYRKAPPQDLSCVSESIPQSVLPPRTTLLNPRITLFCFLPGKSTLRYFVRGEDKVALFGESLFISDHVVAGKVQVNLRKKPYLKLNVLTLEPLGRNAEIPVASGESVGPLKGPVHLPENRMKRIPEDEFSYEFSGPRLPSEGRATVQLQLAISPQGRVLDVAVISGPRPLAVEWERFVRKMRYVPFEILGTPAEVDEVESKFMATGPLMYRKVPPPEKLQAPDFPAPPEIPNVPSVTVPHMP